MAINDFSQDSLLCASQIRNDMIDSSRHLGWTALLLDCLEGKGESGIYDKQVTPDFSIAVALSGEHDVAVLRNGRWCDAIYRSGSLGLTHGGDSSRLSWRNRHPNEPFRTAHLYLPQQYLTEAADHLKRPGQRPWEGPVSRLLITAES